MEFATKKFCLDHPMGLSGSQRPQRRHSSRPEEPSSLSEKISQNHKGQILAFGMDETRFPFTLNENYA